MIEKFNAEALYKICRENNLLDENIPYKEFAMVAKEFNKEISREIVDGYSFNTPIGVLSIIKCRKGSKAINWQLSLRNKQRLIDEGKTPYNKENAPEGERWFIYYTDTLRFKWQWKKGPKIKKWFGFIPCIANKRVLGKFGTTKTEEQKANYNVSAPKDYIKPTHSFQDFQNFQTT